MIVILTGMTCGNPGSPANGTVRPADDTHYYNTNVYYNCESGWTLSGGTNPRRCKENGQWTGSIPSCIKSSKKTSYFVILRTQV